MQVKENKGQNEMAWNNMWTMTPRVLHYQQGLPSPMSCFTTTGPNTQLPGSTVLKIQDAISLWKEFKPSSIGFVFLKKDFSCICKFGRVTQVCWRICWVQVWPQSTNLDICRWVGTLGKYCMWLCGFFVWLILFLHSRIVKPYNIFFHFTNQYLYSILLENMLVTTLRNLTGSASVLCKIDITQIISGKAKTL